MWLYLIHPHLKEDYFEIPFIPLVLFNI